MALFSATFTKSTNNCQTMTITDTSNYDNNDSQIDRNSFTVRQIVLKNIFGQHLETKPIVNDQVTFDISNLLTLTPVGLYLTIQLLGGYENHQIEQLYILPCILP